MRLRFDIIPWRLCRCVGVTLRPEGWYSMATHPCEARLTRTLPPQSWCLYPHWAIADFPLWVWQGDTPDSGGAAAMGVRSPHLALSLSGCLSKRTPARATRGEARGHRSGLAQNALSMYPPSFSFLGLVVGLSCPRQVVDWPQCVCVAVDASLPGVARCRFFVDRWVAEGHTARWHWFCVLFVHRPSVWV